MTLDDILQMWKKDAVIDDILLDEETKKSANLHAKYLEIFSLHKLELKKKEIQMDALKKDKWRYYNGKMTQEEMDKNNWKYDPFDGATKPLKSDMDYYYDSDPHIQELVAKIEYQQTLVDTLEEIMNVIRWRHSTIKNIIDWRRFTSGG